jgi:hypothetical protein
MMDATAASTRLLCGHNPVLRTASSIVQNFQDTDDRPLYVASIAPGAEVGRRIFWL